MMACRRGLTDVVTRLLNSDVDVHCCDFDSMPPPSSLFYFLRVSSFSHVSNLCLSGRVHTMSAFMSLADLTALDHAYQANQGAIALLLVEKTPAVIETSAEIDIEDLHNSSEHTHTDDSFFSYLGRAFLQRLQSAARP